MRRRAVTGGILVGVALFAASGAGQELRQDQDQAQDQAQEPGQKFQGQPRRLSIEGSNTVSFLPQASLPPVTVEYQAKVEYLVTAKEGDEATLARPAQSKARGKSAGKAKAKPSPKFKAKAGAKAKGKEAEPIPEVVGGVEFLIHAMEMKLQQGGRAIVESRMNRNLFEGQLMPDTPALSVTARAAPPRLQAILRSFDVPAALLLIDADAHVVGRRFRDDGPTRAVIETLMSIHTPIPRDVAFWQAPTQLAMGQGHTARGALRFEKEKASLDEPGGLVKVKVSGVLKAEGVVVGKLVKDGTYTVTGEQMYDPRTRAWRTSRWSVVIDNDLANSDGLTVARAQGKMVVQTAAINQGAETDPPAPKP